MDIRYTGLRERALKAITGQWEVFAHLVVAAVFKTVGRHVNRIASGFDSHTLPPKIGAVQIGFRPSSPRESIGLNRTNRTEWESNGI